jgi:type 1 glutamine amidotransferase
MRRLFTALAALFLFALFFPKATAFAQRPAFRALAFYSTHGESDHVQFAREALRFYGDLARKDHFVFDSTTRWSDLNTANLNRYQVILWLDDFPIQKAQRDDFEKYMEHGGGWIGFHVAGYNDSTTHWPWFANFLGAVFYGNNWPPLPARLIVNDRDNPVTRHLPLTFVSPANEWYSWYPDPRTNQKIKVLLTLDPANYPLGLKDTIIRGDVPVVWTNTQYRMVYMNMGHGDKIFSSPLQNRIFENAIVWLGGSKK